MKSALYAVKNLGLVKNAKNDMLKMDERPVIDYRVASLFTRYLPAI